MGFSNFRKIVFYWHPTIQSSWKIFLCITLVRQYVVKYVFYAYINVTLYVWKRGYFPRIIVIALFYIIIIIIMFVKMSNVWEYELINISILLS